MKIWRKIVIDIDSGAIIEREGEDYSGGLVLLGPLLPFIPAIAAVAGAGASIASAVKGGPKEPKEPPPTTSSQSVQDAAAEARKRAAMARNNQYTNIVGAGGTKLGNVG